MSDHPIHQLAALTAELSIADLPTPVLRRTVIVAAGGRTIDLRVILKARAVPRHLPADTERTTA